MAVARPPGGFTLLELLLVLALIVVCASLVMPAVSGVFSRGQLDAAASEVRTAWAEARLQAIRAGEPVAFQCQLETGRYATSPLAGAAAAFEGGSSEDLGVVRFTQLTLGDPAHDPAIDPEVAACVVFRPDGATDDAIAILTAGDGRTRTVRLRGFTGAATIEDPAFSEGG